MRIPYAACLAIGPAKYIFTGRRRRLSPFAFAACTRLLPISILAILVIIIFIHGLPASKSRPRERPQSQPPLSPPQPPRDPYRYVPTSFDRDSFTLSYPKDRSLMKPLPSGRRDPFPVIQHDFSRNPLQFRHGDPLREDRRQAVKAAFVESWTGYKTLAWGYDELQPGLGMGKNSFGGWGATIFDSLDTLWIMGLEDEFRDAVSFVARKDFMESTSDTINVSETNTRFLSALLAAYELSDEKVLLWKATELADLLYLAFDTPNGLPLSNLNTQNIKTNRQTTPDPADMAVPGSLSLEFIRLTQLTGDIKYYNAVETVTDFLEKTQNKSSLPGMWPNGLELQDDVTQNSQFSIGGSSDRIYDSLLKEHMFFGGLEDRYETMYRTAVDAIEKELLFQPMIPESNLDLLFSGTATANSGWNSAIKHNANADHLSCFSGGMLGIGGKLLDSPRHVDMGKRLTNGCVWAYEASATGTMPEGLVLLPCDSIDEPCPWDEKRWSKEGGKAGLPKGFKDMDKAGYLLRPEVVESLFVMYRITGSTEFQDTAWTMFQQIVGTAAAEAKPSASVTMNKSDRKGGSIEQSFWYTETLKYLYLILSPPDLISLDQFIFTSEGHPLKRL